jgi:hypothetical protein
MFKSQKIILMTLVMILLLSSGMLLNTQSKKNPIQNIQNTSSLFTISVTGDSRLIHYQIDETGVRKIWTKSDFAFDSDVFIKDFWNNGTYAILVVSRNSFVELREFDTGGIIWKTSLTNGGELPNFDIAIGDLTGDGINEIVLSRLVPISESADAIFVFSSITGEILSTISRSHLKQTINPGFYYGGNNIALVDFNDDGKDSLIISYGSSLWNSTSREGKFRLEKWDWNGGELELTWDVTGSDIGGNTRLTVYENGLNSVIVVYGWYNNRIRAFNINGELLWEKQTVETADNLYYAEKNAIISFLDEVPVLEVFDNNYWFNASLGWYSLDLYNGTQLDSTMFTENVRNLIPMAILNDKLYLNILATNVTERLEQYSIDVYDINTKSRIIELNDDGDYWANILHPLYFSKAKSPYYVMVGNYSNPYFLAINDNFELWLNGENGNILLDKQGVITRSYSILNNHDNVLPGEYTNLLQNDSSIVLIIFFIILLLILLLSGVFLRIQQVKFQRDKNYEIVYTPQFIKQNLDKIFTKIKQLSNGVVDLSSGSTNNQLPELESAQTIMPIGYKSSKIGIGDEKVDLKTYIILDSNPNLKDWILNNNNKLKNSKLKINDLAILMEILDTYPENSLHYKDLIDKFKNFDSPKNIYRRLTILQDLELIEEQIPLEAYDLRVRNAKITEYGIELLKSLYSTLDKHFMSN